MTKATRRISGSPAVLAITLIVGLPAIANAQLFPNQNVKRQRPSCAQEPPFNAHVRRDYFGYYPTCWSKFPSGWACPCPNPEMPNAAESFRKQPRDKPSLADPGAEPETDDAAMPGDAAAPDPNLPPMPNPGRSPFEIDAKPNTATPSADGPAGATSPLPAPAPSTPTGPGSTSLPTPAPSTTGLLEMPKLPSPSTSMSREPGSMSLPSPDEDMLAASSDNLSGAPVQANLAPLPMPRAVPSPVNEEAGPALVGGPAQAPARKSVIGSLFNRSKTRRR